MHNSYIYIMVKNVLSCMYMYIQCIPRIHVQCMYACTCTCACVRACSTCSNVHVHVIYQCSVAMYKSSTIIECKEMTHCIMHWDA